MSKYDEKSKSYSIEYAKTKLKRIPLNVQLNEFDQIKSAAAAAGETVNGFIKVAIRQRLESMQSAPEDTTKTN